MLCSITNLFIKREFVNVTKVVEMWGGGNQETKKELPPSLASPNKHEKPINL
jgi:hypothetical protein